MAAERGRRSAMRHLPIDAGVAKLRAWRSTDLDALVKQANTRAVWLNLAESFPHPYTAADGEAWIGQCLDQNPPRSLVIAVDDELIGGCGFEFREGVESIGGLIGYWLGAEHWGRGIATAAVGAFLGYVWDAFPVDRLEARVFAWNPASARVLEKNGFALEGVRRDAICKDGRVTDEMIYGLLRNEDA